MTTATRLFPTHMRFLHGSASTSQDAKTNTLSRNTIGTIFRVLILMQRTTKPPFTRSLEMRRKVGRKVEMLTQRKETMII